tara:strand:- start:337 stop:834 length:498 start_codon:yes stop_codon:yes gene_type:complete
MKISKFIYQYGLLTGLVSVIFGVMKFVLGIHYENDVLSQVVGAVILIGGIVSGQIAFRKENNGLVSFKECLRIGVGIGLVTAIISLAYYFILTNIVEPDFNIKVLEIGYARTIESNPEFASQTTQQQFIDRSLPFVWITYPAIIMVTLFFSLMFSLCTGIVVKRS